jgi:D-sedoheptulose 7-phosphate isomerase
MQQKINDAIEDHLNILIDHKNLISKKVCEISNVIYKAVESGKKIILFGNGGSAADAQHIAAEFTGRFVIERRALPAIALTTDTSALTAIGNDYGFDRIFERQVEAIACPGDILIGISTSGNSKNVINAFELGKKRNCRNISFTGNDGGELLKLSEFNINIESNVTARIQEIHIIVGHLICKCIDDIIFCEK